MPQGEVIGWMAVFAIGITFVVTLLGLTGVLKIGPGYLKALYGLVVVELVGAGFFLFRMTFEPPVPTFDPDLPASVYLIDAAGEPLPDTELRMGDEVQRQFPRMEDTALAAVTRRLLPAGSDVVVTSDSGTVLGKVSAPSNEVRQRFRSFQNEFALGMYYAQCAPDESGNPCGNRRDGPGSVRHLLGALRKLEGGGEARQLAVRQLFFVLDYFSRCEHFQQYVGEVEAVRPPPARYHELAEAYGEFARRVADGTEVANARKAALKYYLTYLAEARADANPLVEPSTSASLGLLTLLAPMDAPLQARRNAIVQDLTGADGEALGIHAATIRAEPIACR